MDFFLDVVVKEPCIEPSWKQHLSSEFAQPYMQSLRSFLVEEKKQKKVIFPPNSDLFNAFEYTPVDDVKVVILGQDPYHGPNQAHGLCFSVKPQVRIPPSLVNIYKELQSDLGLEPALHGCLTSWAKQGVLLLNSVLTVEQGKAGAHQGKGWETFTDKVIHVINEHPTPKVFVLWGAYAQKKASFLHDRHLVLKSVHPSPLSAHRGFFGSKPFSKINAFLEQHGQSPIDWKLPNSTAEHN